MSLFMFRCDSGMVFTCALLASHHRHRSCPAAAEVTRRGKGERGGRDNKVGGRNKLCYGTPCWELHMHRYSETHTCTIHTHTHTLKAHRDGRDAHTNLYLCPSGDRQAGPRSASSDHRDDLQFNSARACRGADGRAKGDQSHLLAPILFFVAPTSPAAVHGFGHCRPSFR